MADDRSSLRHAEAFVKQVMEGGEAKSLLRKGLEAMLSTLMEAEVEERTGASFGERTEERRTARNGYRSRTYQTGLGTSELSIPKLRQGTYFPSFLRAYKRSDDALVIALATCYQQGVSTRKVEAVARALGIESLKRQQVSEMAAALDPQVKAFRERRLGEFPYVIVDARYENVREDHRVQKMALLVAIGVRRDGMREVLGLSVQPTENEAYWGDFLQDLLDRGLHGVKLTISDDHAGLRNALAKRLPAARWQRCRVHFMRNLAGRLPKRERPAYLALAQTVFAQDSYDEAVKKRAAVAEAFRQSGRPELGDFLEKAEEVLTYMHFPRDHWTKLHSTNLIQRLNREIKRRTRVVSIFPNRKSLVRLAGALLLEEHEDWLIGRRYISDASMNCLYAPPVALGQANTERLLEAAK